MKLHGYWRSSTSYRVRIALNLKGLAYESVPVNLLERAHKSADYLARNPHGSVPMLEAEGESLVQSLAILDWLEDRYPEPSQWPLDGLQTCRELYYAVATELHAPLNPPLLAMAFGDDAAARADYYARVIARTFAPVEQRLAAHDWPGDLPFGQPTVFEIVLVPQLYNARRFDVPLDGYPHILRTEAAALALDAFKAAHPSKQKDAA